MEKKLRLQKAICKHKTLLLQMYEQARVKLHKFDDSVGLVGMGSS